MVKELDTTLAPEDADLSNHVKHKDDPKSFYKFQTV